MPALAVTALMTAMSRAAAPKREQTRSHWQLEALDARVGRLRESQGCPRGAGRQSGGAIHPLLWFDAVCSIPPLAGLPFYTPRHEQDARWWQERFALYRRATSP